MTDGLGRTGLPPRALLSGLVAVAALVVLGVVLGADSILTAVAGTDPVAAAAGLACVVVAVGCWGEAQRRLLVAAGATLSVREGFLGYGTGMFAKQALPGGHALGPGLVAYAFRSLTRRSYGETFAAVTVAELFNFVASAILAGAGILLLVDADPSPVLSAARAGLFLLGGGLGLALGLAWYRRATVTLGLYWLARLLSGTVGRLSRRVRDAVSPEAIAGTIDRFYATVGTVSRQRRQVAVAFGLTVLGWVAFVAPLYVSFRALGVTLPLGVVLFVVPAAGLANVLPLPGGLGGAELAVGGAVVVLTGLDVPTAAAGVVVYRLCSFWFLTALGGVCAAVLHVGASDLAAEVTEGGADAVTRTD